MNHKSKCLNIIFIRIRFSWVNNFKNINKSRLDLQKYDYLKILSRKRYSKKIFFLQKLNILLAVMEYFVPFIFKKFKKSYIPFICFYNHHKFSNVATEVKQWVQVCEEIKKEIQKHWF